MSAFKADIFFDNVVKSYNIYLLNKKAGLTLISN